MFEGVHDQLLDPRAYLRRIGIEDIPEPTRENLDRLIYAHLTHVPYENLSYCIEKKCPDLTIPALFDKIVTHGRGGYCFELNGLFYALLLELGYEAYPVACRMWLGLGQLPVGHRASIVTIAGEKYFADVGTSGMAGLCAVPYRGESKYGVRIAVNGREHEVRRVKDGEDSAVISYVDSYFDPVDFIPLNYYCAVGPAAADRPDPVVNLTTEDGAYSIDADVFRVRRNGKTTERKITDGIMMRDILKRYFSIVLEE